MEGISILFEGLGAAFGFMLTGGWALLKWPLIIIGIIVAIVFIISFISYDPKANKKKKK